MSKQIYINLPVTDLERSTAYYKALGFEQNPMFSDSHASCMKYSEDISVMLLTYDFYKNFIGEKTIADTVKTNSVLLALMLDSKEEVQEFADKAKENGGHYYMSDVNKDLDFMFSYEVVDPDGHIWEVGYMDITKFPKQ
jgi:predicted lactoylglutathione lyase